MHISWHMKCSIFTFHNIINSPSTKDGEHDGTSRCSLCWVNVTPNKPILVGLGSPRSWLSQHNGQMLTRTKTSNLLEKSWNNKSNVKFGMNLKFGGMGWVGVRGVVHNERSSKSQFENSWYYTPNEQCVSFFK
jgi:hypothetical protein